MPIKAGQLMASAPGQSRTTISDGKRPRVLWADGDGDGESSDHIIERSQGSNEPPHDVYLDDHACYLIWSSHKYTKQELRGFWPFDFDSSGKIKAGRLNRGRPAFTNASHSDFAKAPLRGKNKMYEFCGAPDWTPPLKEEEFASDAVKTEQSDTRPSPRRGMATPPRETPNVTGASIPTTTDASSAYPARPDWGLGNGRVPFKPGEPTRYIFGPVDRSLKPLGMAHKAMQGSPYFDIPAAGFRSRPRPRGGDLGASLGIVSKRKSTEISGRTSVDPVKLDKATKKKVADSPALRSGGGFIRSLLTNPDDAAEVSMPVKKVKVEQWEDELTPPNASVSK
ncbi:hypothetical protein EK21DRAFT_96025 [Setomelanomma holmii]|uniref:Uncharacterized protein n=1 Tax=Setomelanomma holmii TaxID=210430 RepID=A0A9P4HMQ8_9PLEO|nr:hypothetical protein EK21DRAFT_96025 [Setomelanomma holmii]